MKAVRDLSVESLRGLAILAVVFIHVSTLYQSAPLVLGLAVLSKFCVPLFVFLTGYFISKQSDVILNNYFGYLKKFFTKTYFPYVIVCLVAGVLMSLPFVSLVKKIIFGTLSVPHYYMFITLQFCLISIFLVYLFRRIGKYALGVGILCTMFYSLVFYFQIYYKGVIFIPLFMWQSPYYFLWLFLGFYVSEFGVSEVCRSCKWYILLLLSFLSAFIENYSLRKLGFQDGDYISFFSVIFETIAVLFLWFNRHIFDSKFLQYMGRHSFYIFLCHFIFMVAIAKHYGVTNPFVIGVASVSMSILVGYLAKNLGVLFGFCLNSFRKGTNLQ